MKREIVKTEDGSVTLYVPDMNEHYHSVYGAKTESMHVFINLGFKAVDKKEISVFEVGFGTGLNAFLTFKEAMQLGKTVHYESVELYPLNKEEYLELNYISPNEKNDYATFISMHSSEWEKEHLIHDKFVLKKIEASISNLKLEENKYDLIYFDAFAPEVQPKLWKRLVFKNLYNSLKKGGILTTYCSKGAVRRALKEVGFNVEKHPGPPPKREIVRAIK